MNEQKLYFPVGTIVINLFDIEGVTHNGITFGGLPKGKYGIVVGHTIDGRAIMNFGIGVHTFDNTVNLISTVDANDYSFDTMLDRIAKKLP